MAEAVLLVVAVRALAAPSTAAAAHTASTANTASVTLTRAQEEDKEQRRRKERERKMSLGRYEVTGPGKTQPEQIVGCNLQLNGFGWDAVHKKTGSGTQWRCWSLQEDNHLVCI